MVGTECANRFVDLQGTSRAAVQPINSGAYASAGMSSTRI